MKTLPVCGILAILALAGAVACAQPPEGGPPGGPGGGPGGERRGPPSPERFVEHAMSFDADADGKLDRAELTKFAEEMHAMRMRGGPGGEGRGPGGQRRGPGGQGRGPGGPDGEGDFRRGPPPGGDGERPQRPRRPE
ncbi:MAG: hypothetical protein EBZ74_05140 [Planctomycetia bacterium]|nr:hypothetical protein [Planctomycetia bacterium]